MLAALLLAALVGLIIWLVHKYNIKMPNPFRQKEAIPPHVEAIKALEALHHQKLWQNSRFKDYYSGLTDILRRYIAARYEFGAMEMTTDEIVATLRGQELPDKSRRNLVEILRTADLVKFARVIPDEQYHEQAYLDAYYFVEETKAVEVIEAESDETKKEIND
jgi:cell division protein YceG involved in septum cleavage